MQPIPSRPSLLEECDAPRPDTAPTHLAACFIENSSQLIQLQLTVSVITTDQLRSIAARCYDLLCAFVSSVKINNNVYDIAVFAG